MQALRYTPTTVCLARGTATLTPALRRAPPVALAGGEAYPLAVDERRGLVLGLEGVYRALKVAPNETLLLAPTPEGILFEVKPRAKRPKPPPPRPQTEEPEKPQAAKKAVRLLPGGKEVVEAHEKQAPSPPPPSHALERAARGLAPLGFLPVPREGVLLASRAGPLLLSERPSPQGAFPRAHLVGPGPRLDLEALEVLRRYPVGPGRLLSHLERGLPLDAKSAEALGKEAVRSLEARAPLTALLRALARFPVGERIDPASLAEEVPEAKAFLPFLAAPPLELFLWEGTGYRLARSPREALRDLLQWAVAVLGLLERPGHAPEGAEAIPWTKAPS